MARGCLKMARERFAVNGIQVNLARDKGQNMTRGGQRETIIGQRGNFFPFAAPLRSRGVSAVEKLVGHRSVARLDFYSTDFWSVFDPRPKVFEKHCHRGCNK